MFCGAAKLTSAHLISRSLQKLLPAYDGGTTKNDMWIDPAGEGLRYESKTVNVSPFNHQVKRLCHECNGQWMGKMEAETRDLLVALSRGERVSLTSSQQLSLSTWTTVVSMLRSTQDPGRSQGW